MASGGKKDQKGKKGKHKREIPKIDLTYVRAVPEKINEKESRSSFGKFYRRTLIKDEPEIKAQNLAMAG